MTNQEINQPLDLEQQYKVASQVGLLKVMSNVAIQYDGPAESVVEAMSTNLANPQRSVKVMMLASRDNPALLRKPRIWNYDIRNARQRLGLDIVPRDQGIDISRFAIGWLSNDDRGAVRILQSVGFGRLDKLIDEAVVYEAGSRGDSIVPQATNKFVVENLLEAQAAIDNWVGMYDRAG